jgi:hypothetical protein
MPWNYPTPDDDSGRTLQSFVEHGWVLIHGKLSAERLAEGCAMGVKLAGLSAVHRVACAIIYDGHVYFGYSNHGITDFPEKLADAMRQRQATAHSVGNCAEIQAMIGVVNAGYNPQNMGIGLEAYACRTDTGEHVPPCDNCTMLLVGAT